MSDIKITIDDAALQAALKANQERQEALNAAVLKYGPAAAKAFGDAERASKQAATQALSAEKASKRAAAGPSAWTLALQANTGAINEQRSALNQQAEGIGKVSSLLSILDPRLAAVAGGLQKATGAASAAGTALNAAGGSAALFSAAAGPITAVLAAGAYAWTAYKDATERGEKALKAAREEAARVTEVMTKLGEAQFAATLDSQVLSGAITQLEADQRKAAHAIGDQFSDATVKAVDKMDALKAKLMELDAQIKSGDGYAFALLDQQNALNAELEVARGEYDKLNAGVNKLTDTTGKNIVATKEQKDAVKDTTKAVKDLEAAEKALDQTERETAERQGKLNREMVERELANLEAVGAARERAFLDDQAMTAAQIASYQAAGDAREAQINRDIELTQRLAEEQKAAYKDAADGLAAAYDMASDAIGDHLDSIMSDQLSKIEDLESALENANDKGQTNRAKNLKQQIANEKAAAQKTFDQQQTLSASNATVNWLEALVKATTYGPIGGPLVAAAATAAYGFSLKAIESEKPEFTDTPGPVRLGPGNRDVGGMRGAENDSAVFYRDPNQGIAQIVGEAVRRSMPAPPKTSQVAFGLSLGSIGVGRLLTSDLRRSNRNQLS